MSRAAELLALGPAKMLPESSATNSTRDQTIKTDVSASSNPFLKSCQFHNAVQLRQDGCNYLLTSVGH